MVEWFGSTVVATGRLPLFCFFVAFVAGFLLIRMSVRMIRAGVTWWPGNLRPGGLHIHHVVFGVGLMMVGGVAALLITDRQGAPIAVAAGLFGLGAALVLDEFALILHLRDVYWTEQGRASVDAVFVAVALTGLLLTGFRPFGWDWFHGAGPGGAWQTAAQAGLMVLALVNLAGSVVSLLKGKIWTGLTGVFLPAISVVAAIRLAVPGSPWARWRYPAGSAKLDQAVRRDRRIRRPLIKVKIRVQELIAGRHDLEPAVETGQGEAPGTADSPAVLSRAV
ncbi:hypothetical protein [Streptomonospora litoralis]|uniref:Integral membrane protein n=1 Tax=Streptomonospora litoralis TaxID=2498135 RepID=A0A4P6Q0I2_9ACTN|nr:hypothetical protein [Streptomonospora litoralis]QBI52309.1 hypothetical protein EKD16_02465 [Streptomonospora litoralis]